MQKKLSIKLLPLEAEDPVKLKGILAQACAVKPSQVTGYTLLKKSIDARSRKQVWAQLTINVFIDEPFQQEEPARLQLKDVHNANRRVIVVGAGPAGLFAALRLIELGIKPILLERGKDVRARRRDLAAINKEGIVNPESNYCFGEGGAGTYSDGKLYTRSTKRGDVMKVLNTLVQFGAEEKILYEAHPHIGTNKLPHIITAVREKIVECGGEVLFQNKVTDFILKDAEAKGVVVNKSDKIFGEAIILATGHSARDIFHLLHQKKIEIHFKPFALGVRVEHPQALIDAAQYHCPVRDVHLPPASYSLVEQVNGKGVFSFCMCPGGIIAPAATAEGEIVVNGWSPSKRNNPYANSGIVVSVDEKNIQAFQKQGPLAGLYFQQVVEQKAFEAGGGKLVAPAQRMVDFVNNKASSSLPDCSYLPGIHSAPLKEVLPPFVHQALQIAFKEWGKRMRGYFTNDAVVVATESRTSSPVRIPRDESLQHPQIKNLYPCAEGAGYAGGIVSAAMDGERVADAVAVTVGR
ncbi:NAD(P)/FAD-dependent oxidoreductase [Flavisolibacter ginsenosidimutans]|uniref:FAD-binding protein n=1 Tax=Flavisolibacter ginsenosidimutans TaxID=661481 RepID=A0A5B8UHA6_9BACT|nr:FAD-dependent monooxygenase [Flavisolibacter ginsenosidimutans]QEC55878.1 FAD-binding protein [Flavisolibacter ginsenosidimutans]